MSLENLTPEQQAQAAECKTVEEAVALAKKIGHTLSDEELEQISGGWSGGSSPNKYPNCGSKSLDKDPGGSHCLDCGASWD